MSGRRVAAAVAAGLVVLALLVAVGRWERGNRAETQVKGMQRVLSEVGPLDSSSLSAYRYLENFQCLLYRRGTNPLALELCVDGRGRLVEAIDRSGSGDPEIWSLRDDPSRSTIVVDRGEVDRLLRRMGVPQRYIDAAHARAEA